MYRLMRITVPSAQVLVLVVVYLFKFVGFFPVDYYAQGLVERMNYPLLPIWFAVGYSIDRIGHYLPVSWRWSGTVGDVLFGSLIVSSVGLFWYFAVTEFEARRRGESRLSFQGGLKEGLMLTLFLALSAAAFVYVYNTHLDWLPHSRSQGTALETCAAVAGYALGRLILIGWGALFLALAVHDFTVFIRHGKRSSQGAQSL